jgi:TorA maturation chaperone TorD
MMIDSLPQLIQRQEAIYSFLQRIYEKELNKQLILEIPEKIKPLEAVTSLLSNQESKKVMKEFFQFCSSFPSQNLDTLETQLAADYARLFLSINKIPPHPSESAYREGVMMQYYRDEVLQTYWSFGVTARKDFTEPEDHIATEFSFMAFLCQKTNQALKNGNQKDAAKYIEAQKNFLDKHLTRWVPNLVKDILQTSRTPFYKGIAVLTGEFLNISLSATDEILNQLKG